MPKLAAKTPFIIGGLIFLVVAIGLILFYGRILPMVRAGKTESNYSTTTARPSVEAFTFETKDGVKRISDYKGKIVVIDVWATWCGPCIANVANLMALKKKYQGQPFELIGLSIDEQGWADVNPFIAKRPEIDYTLAVPNPKPNFQYETVVDLNPLGNVAAVPTIFFIDRNGKLAAKLVDSKLEKPQDVDQLIAKLLAE